MTNAFKVFIKGMMMLLVFLEVLDFLNHFSFGLGASVLFIWICSYQLLVHYPLMAVAVPGNVMAFLKIVF